MSTNAINVNSQFDLMTAESTIRAEAQKALTHAIVRSVKVGFRTVLEILREASEMQKKHAKKYDCGAI